MSELRQQAAPASPASTSAVVPASASAVDSGPVGKMGRPSFKRTLTFFGFFAITASMVMTVYEYPSFASSGFHLVFFLIIGGILWFLPVALCAAEMATVKGWESGGIFAWVGNTLGRRWGFAALFFQWFQITVGFVTMAFFILAAFAYVVGWDALYKDPLVMFFGVAAIVWLLTLTQLGGTKYTARISKVGFVGGIIVPVLVLLAGLLIYFATGGMSQIAISPAAFVPDFSKADTLVIFASFILAYMGVEASASHVNELKNPNRNYPLAMIILAVLTIALDALGGLAVATTLPASVLDGNLSFGVIEAFRAIYVEHIGPAFSWIVFAVALLLALGVLAEISAWIVGPSRALLDTAHDGILPPSFKKVNKHGVSVRTVVVQAAIVTMWDAVLCGSIALSGGSSSSVGYLTAIGLTVVIYLVGYVLFFLGYFVLVLRKKSLPRSFQLPGGTPFKVIVAGVGLVMTLATLVISFFPSSNLTAQANQVYQITLFVAFAVSVALPFVIYSQRHRWAPKRGLEAMRAAAEARVVDAASGAAMRGGAGAGAAGVRAGAAVPGAAGVRANAEAPGTTAGVRAGVAPGAADVRAGVAVPSAGQGSGKINKRTRAKENLSSDLRKSAPRASAPRASGASGMTADTGVGGSVARTISAAVVSVTSRPASPFSVDARETSATVEEVRGPSRDSRDKDADAQNRSAEAAASAGGEAREARVAQTGRHAQTERDAGAADDAHEAHDAHVSHASQAGRHAQVGRDAGVAGWRDGGRAEHDADAAAYGSCDAGAANRRDDGHDGRPTP
ncbi:Glutamate/gamma-aminobutyrate antiporter [Coriobacteriaceae bacterium CHKCI002]|nr:Glutamate/gamma-aminobutyrate antiporter [Coriobacteriaceae bacterium CHKCI002]